MQQKLSVFFAAVICSIGVSTLSLQAEEPRDPPSKSSAETDELIVSADNYLNIRSAPRMDSRIIGTAAHGTLLRVLAGSHQTAKWVHVRTSKGVEGFAATKFLRPTETNASMDACNVLSKLAQATLNRFPEAKGFHVATRADFDTDSALDYFMKQSLDCPFVIQGDFNGDGRHHDLAILAINSKHATAGAKVFILHEGQRRLWQIDDSGDAILRFSKRTFKSPFEDSKLVMKADGVEVLYLEKAGVLYYWNGKKYNGYVTSD